MFPLANVPCSIVPCYEYSCHDCSLLWIFQGTIVPSRKCSMMFDCSLLWMLLTWLFPVINSQGYDCSLLQMFHVWLFPVINSQGYDCSLLQMVHVWLFPGMIIPCHEGSLTGCSLVCTIWCTSIKIPKEQDSSLCAKGKKYQGIFVQGTSKEKIILELANIFTIPIPILSPKQCNR